VGLQVYAFPSFFLIGRCAHKVREEGATILLVDPVRSTQGWYPLLLEMLMDLPFSLPMYTDLLRDPFNRPHPLLAQGALQLATWNVSSRSSWHRAFLERQQTSLLWDGVKEPTWHMNQPGRSTLAGVTGGRSLFV